MDSNNNNNNNSKKAAAEAAQQQQQPVTYLQRLQQSSAEKSLEAVQFQAEETRLQLQSDRLESQKQLSAKRRQLNEQKGAFPLSASAIIKTQGEITGLENGLAALDELEAELFPTTN